MKPVPIEVTSYSGRKGDELPRTFTLRGDRIDVLKIVEAWIDERFDDRIRRRCFTIQGSDGKRRLIYYQEHEHQWYSAS